MKNRFLKPTFHGQVCSATIERSEHIGALGRLMARFPVVALLGARQVGKTTLAHLKNIFTESKGDWYEL